MRGFTYVYYSINVCLTSLPIYILYHRTHVLPTVIVPITELKSQYTI